ncbi:Endonuclease/Exonuclease/phosphatase family protein [Posidoniimonas polymericola]|uniref:Endonuclease/Exonuclease/phosphatase family protein n=1 Tax=Posidoniimonas polymericola TaxID=2528002 RepID=A0A5C5XWW0_9BACT|nr:endonuclease/exonuclease/phosphatase family protein [Posidoniimonas polymericola]TWT67001.1 Endonuclease/Exonuclease/phosphatase family protein [Posidoniimonas polymericola]
MNRLLPLALLLCPTLLFAEEATPLRIMTFNVEILTAPGVRAGQLQKYRFDYARERHLDRAANVIEVLNPDILNLVEGTSREVVDAIVARLHAKGLNEYTGYHIESNDSFTGMDVSLITKFPPQAVDGKQIRTYFSKDDDPIFRQAYRAPGYDGKPRNFSASLSRNSSYFIEVAGYKLGFLGLHLKSNPSDEFSNAQRTAQAKIVARILNGEVVRRGYLPVVLGDLNDYDPTVPDRDDTRDPVTDVLARIKDFDPDHEGDELFNAAEFIPNKEDRYTSHWDWNENGADDPQDVYTMIDHILLPVELKPYVKRAFIAHVVNLETSDHYPVVVDLELPAKP